MEKKTKNTVTNSKKLEESKQTVTPVVNTEYNVEDDPKVKEYERQLYALRKDGVIKKAELNEEISSIKKNKLVDRATKESIITKDKEGIVAANSVIAQNKQEIARIVKEACAYIKETSKKSEKEINDAEKLHKEEVKSNHAKTLDELSIEHEKAISEINTKYATNDTNDNEEAFAKKQDLKNESFRYKSVVYDENSRYNSALSKIRDHKYTTYMNRRNEVKRIRNGKTSVGESLEYKFKNYAYQFVLKNFLVRNALYIVIVIFFIACCIIAPAKGYGNLLSFQNIFNILENSSTRMFYALGVAGLILIAGTDLSIGRMVALGSVTTAVILHKGDNIVTFFGMAPLNFDAWPMFGRVMLAIILSVILCTLFSMLAGFFTARFKMHPFISTLSTQLIIYGLLFYMTSGTSTGNVESGIKDLIGGRWSLGVFAGESLTFPKLIIPMILIIVVIWFIWNKTKFGKNMYAVGGNAEAASVSGINVFKTTMGIFILAGVCYGLGSFLEAFRANTSAGTGQGYELDAIAACVVGGISFNGGVGKVKGAVIGVFIFTALTYCLNFLKIDTNLQFVFKGIIILTAVALDCIKYLKKK
jgi:methyl-galactoside transport system permease protein